jgi:glycosyltransferase involved in cell wall biosynthesis
MEEMLAAQARRGHSVTVVVPRIAQLMEGERQGVSVVGAPYAPQRFQEWGYGRSLNASGGLKFSAVATTPLALGSMARTMRILIARDKPDVVHLHWVLPQGVLASVIPSSIPVVVSAHGADARYAGGRLVPISRRVLMRADALVAASSPILQVMGKLLPEVIERSHVIPHGANSDLFRPFDRVAARARLAVTGNPLVLGIGRLTPKKGFGNLIRAVAHIRTGAPRLVIVGDGPERRPLEELARSLAPGQVDFVGIKRRQELAAWYAASDVVVVPSMPLRGDIDSGPVVLMEAMASGRPVVSTRVGMAPDVIESEVNGLLLDTDHPRTMARAIEIAIENSGRWGLAARATFESIGDWSRVARQLEDVYREAIIRRRGSAI